jgi:hypothetical protein
VLRHPSSFDEGPSTDEGTEQEWPVVVGGIEVPAAPFPPSMVDIAVDDIDGRAERSEGLAIKLDTTDWCLV